MASKGWRLPLHQMLVSRPHLQCPPPPPPPHNCKGRWGGTPHPCQPLRWWKSTPAKGKEAPPPYAGGHATAGGGGEEHIFMLQHLVVPLYFLESPEDPEDSPLHPFFSSCAVELLHVHLIHLFEGP